MLEALARGQCVVAPDCGTMNEYIINGKNGLLYDINDPCPLNFDNAAAMGSEAYESTAIGYKNWNNSQQRIINFIITPPSVYYKDINRFDIKLLNPGSLSAHIATNNFIKPFKSTIRSILRRI